MGRAGRAWYVRAAVLAACGALYLGMWSSYVYFNAEVVHNGDKIKLREAVGNFVKSPAVQVTSPFTFIFSVCNDIKLQEFWRNLKTLYQHMQINGFWSTWSQLVESLDPFGEKNALKVMDLKAGSSQEEIRSRYRELTKQFHPDKVQGTQEEKEAANEKFVQIQQVNRELRSQSFL